MLAYTFTCDAKIHNRKLWVEFELSSPPWLDKAFSLYLIYGSYITFSFGNNRFISDITECFREISLLYGTVDYVYCKSQDSQKCFFNCQNPNLVLLMLNNTNCLVSLTYHWYLIDGEIFLKFGVYRSKPTTWQLECLWQKITNSKCQCNSNPRGRHSHLISEKGASKVKYLSREYKSRMMMIRLNFEKNLTVNSFYFDDIE